MAEVKLGNKHECTSCGAKFYDFGKPEVICPKCGTNQRETEEDDDSAEDGDSAEIDAEPAKVTEAPKDEADKSDGEGGDEDQDDEEDEDFDAEEDELEIDSEDEDEEEDEDD